ncbi:MAG: tetratricopeptide repeat protein, partial [Elusimicrobiota bacterium]
VCVGGGLVERRLADFRSEEAFFRATLKVDPNVPRARLNLAMLCADDERFECAEAECLEAVRLWPNSVKTRISCSDILISRGRWRQARELLEGARRLAPEDPSVRARLSPLGESNEREAAPPRSQ